MILFLISWRTIFDWGVYRGQAADYHDVSAQLSDKSKTVPTPGIKIVHEIQEKVQHLVREPDFHCVGDRPKQQGELRSMGYCISAGQYPFGI